MRQNFAVADAALPVAAMIAGAAVTGFWLGGRAETPAPPAAAASTPSRAPGPQGAVAAPAPESPDTDTAGADREFAGAALAAAVAFGRAHVRGFAVNGPGVPVAGGGMAFVYDSVGTREKYVARSGLIVDRETMEVRRCPPGRYFWEVLPPDRLAAYFVETWERPGTFEVLAVRRTGTGSLEADLMDRRTARKTRLLVKNYKPVSIKPIQD